MKKTIILSFIAASTALFGCKSKSKDASVADSSSTTTTTTSSTTEESKPAATNQPKTYTVTFSPDTALLGKAKEAALKLTPISATDLSDPDGKSEGIEVSFKIALTNKNKIGGNSIGVAPSDFRLVLDNNTSISQQNGGYISAEPESTKESEAIVYRIPAGAKPKALNLFYDQTRATVALELK